MIKVDELWQKIQPLVYLGQRWLVKAYKMPWVQSFIRLGYGVKGMFYGLIGLFLVNDLIHDQQVVSGSDGVLVSLGNRPLGSIMLALLAVGLLGYGLWRFMQATLNPDTTRKFSLRQGVQRCGYAISGVTYLGIARTAGQLALGLAVDFDDTIEDVASLLFERAIGPWMLLGIGLGVVAVGLTYVYGAATGSYISEFRHELYSSAKSWVVAIGKIGITARGVGFILIGGYLMKAAYQIDDDSAGGLGNVFDQLDDEPYGELWLGAIAFGFMAYAVYMIVAAFYRKFPASP